MARARTCTTTAGGWSGTLLKTGLIPATVVGGPKADVAEFTATRYGHQTAETNATRAVKNMVQSRYERVYRLANNAIADSTVYVGTHPCLQQ